MLSFNGTDAYRAVLDFWGRNAGTLPEPARRAMLDALAGSDMLTSIIGAMDALYAARADLGEPGINLLGGLARFVADNNFHGKGIRAAQIAGVAARIAGGGNPEAEGDPEVDAAFAADLSRKD